MMPVIKTSELFGDNGQAPPFKSRKSFATRLEETEGIRSKFPTKIPVIVERYRKELELPTLDKTKFLVPQELSMSQFITIIRSRMSISSTQAFFLLVNKKSMMSLSMTLSDVYKQEKDNDGFLYMTYCSQEGFGAQVVASPEEEGEEDKEEEEEPSRASTGKSIDSSRFTRSQLPSLPSVRNSMDGFLR